ncbi:DMT family transporter [Streptosporangium subroseum]|uniref:DMT family transporter n=1 Tax=Streptosporangium subroseum TaxID=106412 RepID=UPI00308F5809|nr:EamA family transporter [Streptosporangium subroseum]
MKLAVVGAAVLWGTAGTAGLLVAGVDPVSLAAARLVIGGLVLAIAAGPAMRSAASRRIGTSPQVSLRTRTPPVSPSTGTPPVSPRTGTPSTWFRTGSPAPASLRLGTLLPAAVAVAAYQLCYFAAVSRTGVAIGTVVAIGSGPVFTGLLSWMLDRVPPTRRWAGATAVAIIGCAVLTGGGGEARADGILLALLGGLLYAFYAVTAARVISGGASSDAVMGVMFGGAAVVMVPVLLWTGTGWLAEPRGLLTALYLGCATTALAYFLYGRGLRTTPVATAATLALAEPAVAALLGVAVLGERLTLVSVAGLLLLGASLVAVALPERAGRAAGETVPVAP